MPPPKKYREKKQPKKEEKAYRGRKLIATLRSFLLKDSRSMESLKGF